MGLCPTEGRILEASKDLLEGYLDQHEYLVDVQRFVGEYRRLGSSVDVAAHAARQWHVHNKQHPDDPFSDEHVIAEVITSIVGGWIEAKEWVESHKAAVNAT